MHSSSIVHLVLASQPVLSISVAVRVAASSAHPQSWLRSVPVGAQEGAPQHKQVPGTVPHPPGATGGDTAFTLSPQPLASRINAAWPAPRAPGVDGDLAGLPQGEGLPGVHREYSGCSPAVGKTSQRICREQSNSYPKHKGDGEEKKPVQTRRGRHSVKRPSRQGGSWART